MLTGMPWAKACKLESPGLPIVMDVKVHSMKEQSRHKVSHPACTG